MYIQEISIDITNTKLSKEDVIDQFDLLMAFYRSSGQTQGRIESQYVDSSKIVCLPFTIEKNALEKKYNNFFVNRQRKNIEGLFNSSLQFKTLGKSSPRYKGGCKCNVSDFYLLVTNYASIDSPITCGTCNKSVPLYRLPLYKND